MRKAYNYVIEKKEMTREEKEQMDKLLKLKELELKIVQTEKELKEVQKELILKSFAIAMAGMAVILTPIAYASCMTW